MRRIISVILCLFVFVGLFGCSSEENSTQTASQNSAQPQLSDARAKEMAANQTAKEKKKKTLMVYMVGSDLEAKGGAGTDDMEEIEQSGLDISTTHVVVFTGGSKKWHNDVVDAVEQQSILYLSGNGFERVGSVAAASMGEKENLAGFLNYAHSYYPADEYALILWDHGNGPLIGYGKDMLYDNDSLTLAEMQSAFRASPFTGEKKLSWVGFDACLMASAELACVVSEFSHYLVASQEVEPSFGWNYSFLSKYSSSDTPSLIKNIASEYLTACEAYYKKKGYTDRDTTLSCMDLSHAGELQSSLNALFAAALKDIDEKYSLLTARRVESRALGRASTGSEYDLIDLSDLAAQMVDLYPTEAVNLRAAVEKTVIENRTNTTDCCGLSLYYPFYNKTYYEKDWAEIYNDLGIFKDYLTYLESYASVWLRNDFLAQIAESRVPDTVAQGTYSLSLSEKQAENYARARFIVLAKEGEGLYNPLFSSYNVQREGQTLVANFDGKIIYCKDKFNNFFIPVSQEHDTVGNVTRYSVYANATNRRANMLDNPEGYELQVAGMLYHLAIGNSTREIALSALTPCNSGTGTNELLGGKLEDVDLSKYTTMVFPQADHLYMTRFENGTICPISQWHTSGMMSQNHAPIGDGIEFVFAPLTSGVYSLIFEIEDTQGNRYCSEILPIQTTGTLPEKVLPDTVSVEWTSGDKVDLGTFSNVKFSVELTETYSGKKFNLVCENKNDFAIYFYTEDAVVNGNIYCHDFSTGYVDNVAPGQKFVYEYGMSFGIIQEQEILKQLKQLEFSLTVLTADTNITLVKDQPIELKIKHSPDVTYGGSFFKNEYDKPCLGMLAKEQVVYQQDGVKMTLLGLGGSGGNSNYLNGIVKVEHSGNDIKHFRFDNIFIDDVMLQISCANISAVPGLVSYYSLTVSSYDIEDLGLTSGSTVQLLLRKMKYVSLEGGGGFAEFQRCNVKLAQKGKKAVVSEGTKVIFNENGVRLSLLKSERNSWGGLSWTLVAVNESNTDYVIDVCDIRINGKEMQNDGYIGLGANDNMLCAGKRTVMEINYFEDVSNINELVSHICFKDLSSERILKVSDSEINWVE